MSESPELDELVDVDFREREQERQERAQQPALGALLDAFQQQSTSITEETVRRSYHELSSHYKCDGCEVAETKEKRHFLCSRCKQCRYCSKECQIRRWKEHKGICKLLTDTNSGPSGMDMLCNDSNERKALFKEKYIPMMAHATYWELKLSTEEMVMIIELEDLPAECKAPRLGIKSFRQESIRSQPDSVQHYCTESLIHAPSSDRRMFALVRWTAQQANGESIVTNITLPFDVSCEEEDESARDIFQAGIVGGLTQDSIQIGIWCHQKASTYVETINDMARGRKKNLSKAAKPRRR
jgi:hypothetical protein